jgi:hypothetical protein
MLFIRRVLAAMILACVTMLVALFTLPVTRIAVVAADPPLPHCVTTPEVTAGKNEKCSSLGTATCVVDVVCGAPGRTFLRQAQCFDFYTAAGHFCYRRCDSSAIACR